MYNLQLLAIKLLSIEAKLLTLLMNGLVPDILKLEIQLHVIFFINK